ncbi:MAG: DUF4328 domain-containing protein, partial [Actinomycetota bacterium]|nr:DUF4328 domain-containing protein [Actinomycetota bacterium]
LARDTVRPARLARFLASGLILLTTGIAGLALWQSWRSYWLVRDVLSPMPTVRSADLEWARQVSVTLSWAWLGGLALSGIAFLAWLWRARINSARLCDAPQRLRIRWSLGSWFVPGLNLWWPQMVVSDVWRASRPDVAGRGADLRAVRPSRLVTAWWTLFLLANAVDLVAVHLLTDDGTVSALLAVVIANTASGGCTALAALAILVIMRRIDRWQTGRLAVR